MVVDSIPRNDKSVFQTTFEIGSHLSILKVSVVYLSRHWSMDALRYKMASTFAILSSACCCNIVQRISAKKDGPRQAQACLLFHSNKV